MQIVILLCVLFITVQATVRRGKSPLAKSYDVAGDIFEEEYIKYVETGVKSPQLDNLLMMLRAPIEIRRREYETLSDSQQSVTCALCKSAVNVLLKYRRDGKDADYMRNLAVGLCVQANIQPAPVCEGLIDKMLNVLLHIVDEKPSLSALSICSVLLQGPGCTAEQPHFDWKVEVSPYIERTPIAAKSFIPPSTADDLKIVHLTDIHYDPLYEAGSLANCPNPMCCRSTGENLTDVAESAGYWGDYRDCDSPLHLVENSLDAILSEHPDADYIYYTGDYIDHAIWLTSVEGNKKSIHAMDELLKEKFKGIPLFPLIGNHEPDPLNLFAPEYVKEKGLESGWLYDYLAEEWSTWLPKEAQETVRKGGYYTVSPQKGFRIIGINNNDCYTFNFWLLFDPSYLKKQLQWLQDTLFEAERVGEYVHILAHIPSGSGSCHYTWSREFTRIVDRYHNTISGIFNGHTHKDHFQVYYSKSKPSVPVNVAWNGGSITPYSNVNPNYRVYGVEPKTYQIVHHETWITNLTLANLHPDKSPEWVKEYTFAEAYGAEDLSPAGLDQLLHKFASNKTLLKKYWTYKFKLGDPTLKAGCGDNCLKNHLCDMATTQGNDLAKCDELLKVFAEKNE